MAVAFSGLTGPALKFAVAVNKAFSDLASVRLRAVATTADLPNAQAFDLRQVAVRDLGSGDPGVVTSINGAWIKADGSIV